MDHEDLALDHLRAADPARDAEADLGRLRAAVDVRIAAEAGGDGVAPVTDLTHAPSRRARWLRVASAAAGAVVIGAVGFGLGNGTLLGSSGGSGTDQSATAGVASDEAAGAAAEPAPDRDMAGGMGISAPDEASKMMWPFSERQVFRAVGLPDEAGTATTWGFDAAGAFSEERIAEIAAVLGVEGEPELADGSWHVGSLEGDGPYVMLYPDGQASLNFYDPDADPWNCAAVREGSAGECPSLGDAPGDDEARQLTRDLLAQLGQDPDGFELQVSKDEAAGWISIAANQLVDGNPSGLSWWANYSGAGLQNLSGSLATLTELGDYPVVGAQEAVSRITDPRFGTIGGFAILPAVREAEVLGGDVAADTAPIDPTPTAPPAPPAPGSPVRWPVEDVAITAADLGVAQWSTPDGVSLLVPAWSLSAENGRTWTVLALAEDALDMAPLEEAAE